MNVKIGTSSAAAILTFKGELTTGEKNGTLSLQYKLWKQGSVGQERWLHLPTNAQSWAPCRIFEQLTTQGYKEAQCKYTFHKPQWDIQGITRRLYFDKGYINVLMNDNVWSVQFPFRLCNLKYFILMGDQCKCGWTKS